MFNTTYTQIDCNPVYRDDYLYCAEKKKKRDGFVVVAQSKLLCLYFISVWGDCWRRLSHEPAWPRFELTRLAPSRGHARNDGVGRVTGCVNPMSLLLPLFPDAQMPSPPAAPPPLPPSWHLSSWHHQAWGVKMQSRLHARHSLCAHRASLAPRAKQAKCIEINNPKHAAVLVIKAAVTCSHACCYAITVKHWFGWKLREDAIMQRFIYFFFKYEYLNLSWMK